MGTTNLQNTEFSKMSPVGNLPETSKETSITFLNELLANEFALFTKTLNFHWNIIGPRFHSLHEFLEEQYKDQLQVMDDVAERVRVLGGRPLSTVDEMSHAHKLNENPSARLEANEMIAELFHDHMLIQHQIKEILDDETRLKRDHGTEDFLVGLLCKHEKTSWMLNSHLEKQ